MEPDQASRAERTALDLIRDIREIERDPVVTGKLDELERAVQSSKQEITGSGAEKPRRQFGAFAGKFSIGPEFFEPISAEDRQAWGED